MAILPLPALPLPGSWLLAHAILFAAAAALVIGAALAAILVGREVARAVKQALEGHRA